MNIYEASGFIKDEESLI